MDNIVMTILNVIYVAFKVIIIAGLIVGIGISQQCHNQMVEICQMAGGCD